MSNVEMPKKKVSISGFVPTSNETVRTGETKSETSKRVSTNRSVTCSEELRNRLKIMAAKTNVPMQKILENWMEIGLKEAGY